MTRIDTLRGIFHGVNLIVNSKISNEVQDLFNTHSSYTPEHSSSLEDTKFALEKQLRFAQEDLRHAKKAYHSGHITRDEVYDIEWRIDELKSDIEDINNRLD